MPDPKPKPARKTTPPRLRERQFAVVVVCTDPVHQRAVYDRLLAEGHKLRVIVA